MVDTPSLVEAEDAVAAGQQDQESAGLLSAEEEHLLSPAGDAYIADDRRAGRVLSTRDAKG